MHLNIEYVLPPHNLARDPNRAWLFSMNDIGYLISVHLITGNTWASVTFDKRIWVRFPSGVATIYKSAQCGVEVGVMGGGHQLARALLVTVLQSPLLKELKLLNSIGRSRALFHNVQTNSIIIAVAHREEGFGGYYKVCTTFRFHC